MPYYLLLSRSITHAQRMSRTLERAGITALLFFENQRNSLGGHAGAVSGEAQPLLGGGLDADRVQGKTEGRALVLGGVTVPWEKGLLGHSDADVLLHALMDALLGAAAAGAAALVRWARAMVRSINSGVTRGRVS